MFILLRRIPNKRRLSSRSCTWIEFIRIFHTKDLETQMPKHRNSTWTQANVFTLYSADDRAVIGETRVMWKAERRISEIAVIINTEKTEYLTNSSSWTRKKKKGDTFVNLPLLIKRKSDAESRTNEANDQKNYILYFETKRSGETLDLHGDSNEVVGPSLGNKQYSDSELWM